MSQDATNSGESTLLGSRARPPGITPTNARYRQLAALFGPDAGRSLSGLGVGKEGDELLADVEGVRCLRVDADTEGDTVDESNDELGHRSRPNPGRDQVFGD